MLSAWYWYVAGTVPGSPGTDKDRGGTGRRPARMIFLTMLADAPFIGLIPVRDLTERGVQFTRYAGMTQDDLGVWTTPGGDRVAWFTDPDGNTLSLTTFATT